MEILLGGGNGGVTEHSWQLGEGPTVYSRLKTRHPHPGKLKINKISSFILLNYLLHQPTQFSFEVTGFIDTGESKWQHKEICQCTQPPAGGELCEGY